MNTEGGKARRESSEFWWKDLGPKIKELFKKKRGGKKCKQKGKLGGRNKRERGGQ